MLKFCIDHSQILLPQIFFSVIFLDFIIEMDLPYFFKVLSVSENAKNEIKKRVPLVKSPPQCRAVFAQFRLGGMQSLAASNVHRVRILIFLSLCKCQRYLNG